MQMNTTTTLTNSGINVAQDKNMNILVIGGAGYIGSHQVKTLCDKGYQVTVLDNLNTGFLSAIDSRATFIQGDIRDLDCIRSILIGKKIQAVMHFAALSLVGESCEHPLAYYNNNVHGMEVLLQAMLTTGVKKIVFSSSAAIYGKHELMPITEDYLPRPENPYGETKLAMEKMMQWVDAAHGIKSVALRYFNVAGASVCGTIGECHQPETHLIPILLQVALGKREAISIYGDDYATPDGTCIRDYVHVSDLAQAHILALEYLNSHKQSEIFNVGYGRGFSVQEIIDVARKVTSHTIPAIICPRRRGDPDQLIASNEKIRQVLSWQPEHDDIETIITSAYCFHRTHLNGFSQP